MRRVVITGMGIYSCLGKNLDEVLVSLREGRSGIGIDPKRTEYGYRSPLTGILERPMLKGVLDRRARVCLPEQGEYAYMATAEALRNAGRLIQQGGADSVKLEGGAERAALVKRLVDNGIPVCAHIGLTPQSVLAFGGYGMHGKGKEEADKLLADAKALAAARGEAAPAAAAAEPAEPAPTAEALLTEILEELKKK